MFPFAELICILFTSKPEFNNIDKAVRVSNPPDKSKKKLSVFSFIERIIYVHLSTQSSMAFNPSSDSRGIEFSL